MTATTPPAATPEPKPDPPVVVKPKPRIRAKKKAPPSAAPTPRRRKLMVVMLKVEDGKMTVEEAMQKAGYSEMTARQQSQTMQALRQNSAMQEALRKIGFTEDLFAAKAIEGIAATKGFTIKVGKNVEFKETPDPDVQHEYLKTGAELLDAFPAKRNINTDVGIADLIKAREITTPSDGDPVA